MEKEMKNHSVISPSESKVEKETGNPSSGIGDENDTDMERLTARSRKGGLITIPFIIANEGFEKVASYGLLPNMILYMMNVYHLGFAKANYILFLWSAATNFTPIIGAFLADSYMGRCLTISLGCIVSLLGMMLLWLTAMIPGAKPPTCSPPLPCKSATPAQLFFLIASFGLMSIGAGGIRSASMAFGADQLDKRDNAGNQRALESYFGLYYAATTLSVLVALTGIVYIQDHMGWKVGFGVPVILMFLSVLIFFLASPIYIKKAATTSLFTGFAQVVVAAYRNRKLALPPPESGYYHHEKGSSYMVPSGKLRFLSKACVLQNPEDVTPSGAASNPWNLCTVQQVEELKALIRAIPIWTTGIMMSINISQSAFPLLQANTMDRHLTSSFEIPAGSFGVFMIITITVWLILYDRVLLPLASKIRGKPVRVGTKFRMGAGLFMTAMAMAVSAIVEHIRRRKAIDQGFLNNPRGLVNMSAMWLVPQNVVAGLAEALNAIGQFEFYYTEFPKSMSSVAASLFGLGMAVGSLLASVLLSAVDKCTKREGKESWVSNNINKGRFDYYYWLLAIMSFINLLYYILCSWLYEPCADQVKKGEVEEKEKELEQRSLRPDSPFRTDATA
ncbi:unnamed protein product [Coffea canephora]|uniref:Major facilitator superfamily (MFS) profile domain-containing protein n=1 Tax=Coffea canephora TaxID=49390 RepID=A0A068TPP5_COFCA|nr:unnamed protein product [Coffea canephora]